MLVALGMALVGYAVRNWLVGTLGLIATLLMMVLLTGVSLVAEHDVSALDGLETYTTAAALDVLLLAPLVLAVILVVAGLSTSLLQLATRGLDARKARSAKTKTRDQEVTGPARAGADKPAGQWRRGGE